jgi:hypothetical protein
MKINTYKFKQIIILSSCTLLFIKCNKNEEISNIYYTDDLRYKIVETLTIYHFKNENSLVNKINLNIYKNMSWSDSLIYNYFDISLLDDFDNEYYITDKINDKIDIYIDNFKNNIVEELIFKTKTMNFSNTNRVTIEFENVLIFNDLTPFNYLKRRYEFSGKSRSHSYDELIYSTNTFEVKIPLEKDSINYLKNIH